MQTRKSLRKGDLIHYTASEPPVGSKVLRYGMTLTREPDGWTGVDDAGNRGMCNWRDVFWLGGDSDFVVYVGRTSKRALAEVTR